jgi:DNA-directed RNA polymerase subunit RPC12/RpoP
VTRILNEAKNAYTAYICVLCGNVFSSTEYRWGACEGNETAANEPCNNWSCPTCGGVVVEYARVPAGDPSSAYAAPR